MLYTIYRVTHLESGKYYIGKHQTRDPNDGYMGSGQLVRRAVKKHGLSAFKKEVLHVFETESEMNAKEAELVTEEFCARDDTYNLCPGGQGGWGYVNTLERPESWKYTKIKNMETFKKKVSESSSRGLRKKYEEGYANPRRGKQYPSAIGNSYASGKWITNGEVSRKLKEDSLPEGWRFGRTIHAPVVQDRTP